MDLFSFHFGKERQLRRKPIVKRSKKQKERRRQYLNTSKETLKHATTYLGNPILGVAASATIELVYGLEEEHDLTGKAYKALVDSFFD